MMYVTLINEGKKTETTVGGRLIVIQEGKNWLQKGLAEFITTKIPNTRITGESVECGDDGISVDEIQNPTIKPEEMDEEETDEEVTVVVTEEDIKNNNLEGELNPGDEITLPPSIEVEDVLTIKPEITEEDKKKYEEELNTMTREQLVDVLNFKEIAFAKNASHKKLVKLIVESIK